MNEYNDLVRMRDQLVDGIGPWSWLKSDDGAWDGPKMDWETSHKPAYLKYIDRWDVVVQAGGNQGMYPRLFSEMFKYVYTFEPDQLNFFCLSQNCQKNNIFKFQAALGSDSRQIELNRASDKNTGMHTVDLVNPGMIPMITVDSLNLSACDFIQLDVEGYELNALRGALNTIDSFKPVIACERGNNDILDFLSMWGYKAVGTSKADTIYKVI